MKPTHFKHENRLLRWPAVATYSENVTKITGLPTWTDGEQSVSCWRMSLRERLSALIFGRVWLAVLSGSSQPPVALLACREYLKETGGN